MGGSGSGNHGGRPTIENGLVLDLTRLIRQGLLRPGATCAGTITWKDTRSGRETGRIGYEAHMDEERGWARLHYTTTSPWSGEKTHHDYRVALTSTPQPFGGRRWWWICPTRGYLVAKLYMPAGGGIFASRIAHRLAYRSQRQSSRDRALTRYFTLRQSLGSNGAIGTPIAKPKGMRQATFERKMQQVAKAEAVCNAHLARFVQQFP
jgi:hypothetical protein